MGSEIHKSKFSQQDYEAFERAWYRELEFVKLFFSNPAIFLNELEACILDSTNLPYSSLSGCMATSTKE